MERLPDGTVSTVASRYHGNRLAVAGDLLVFDQLEFDGQVALYSDLYARPVNGGDTRINSEILLRVGMSFSIAVSFRQTCLIF